MDSGPPTPLLRCLRLAQLFPHRHLAHQLIDLPQAVRRSLAGRKRIPDGGCGENAGPGRRSDARGSPGGKAWCPGTGSTSCRGAQEARRRTRCRQEARRGRVRSLRARGQESNRLETRRPRTASGQAPCQQGAEYRRNRVIQRKFRRGSPISRRGAPQDPPFSPTGRADGLLTNRVSPLANSISRRRPTSLASMSLRAPVLMWGSAFSQPAMPSLPPSR
jgi:hypothetical protein